MFGLKAGYVMWRSFLFLWRCRMCEARVYVSRDGEEQEVMEDVVLVQPDGDAYLLVNLLGEQKLVQGTIEKIDFLRHTLLVRAQESPAVES
jgi:predicted RNA-binding protein